MSAACPSVSKEELGYHWKDFDEISYLSTFRKAVKKTSSSSPSSSSFSFSSMALH